VAGQPPGPPGPTPKRQVPPATDAEREAALRLGYIYEYVAASRDLPLDARSLPVRLPVTHPTVLAALQKLHGSDNERDRRRGTGRYVDLPTLYKRDYDALKPRLHRAILEYAMTSLTAEELELGRLLTKIEQEPGLADTLHTLCQEVIKEAGGVDPTDQEVWESYETVIPAPTKQEWNYKTGRLETVPAGPERRSDLNERKLYALRHDRLAAKVHAKNNPVLSTLFLHRDGAEILRAYGESAASGTSYAAALVRSAQLALIDFRRELTADETKEHVWRYEAFVRGGVQALGLSDVEGFSGYALEVGRFLSHSDFESFVNFASVAVACLGLIFGGPIGAAVIAAVDLSLATTSTGITYLRDNERELASHGSSFRKPEDKFATTTHYFDTVLASAAALLSGLAFFKSLGPLRQVLRTEGAGVKAAVKAPTAVGKDIAAADAKLAGQESRLASKEARLADDEAKLAGEESRLADGKALNKVDEAPPRVEKTMGKRPGAPAKAAAKEPPAPPVKKTMGKRSPETPTGKPPEGEFKPPTDAERGAEPTAKATESGALAQEQRVDEALGAGQARARAEIDPLPADRAHREGIRNAINARIEALEEEVREVRRMQASVDKNIALANQQRAAARQAGDMKRLATVEARWRTLVENRPTTGNLGRDIARLREALAGTEADWYALLTSNASRELSYLEVAAGQADPRFLALPGKYSVEHIVPRSEIFLIPGFERLTAQQQSWLFSYRRNLIKIPASANSARLNRAYSSLKPSFATRFLRSPEALEDLARAQAELRTELRWLVENPRMIPAPAAAAPLSLPPAPAIMSPVPKPAKAVLGGEYPGIALDAPAPISPVTDPTLTDEARGTGELFGPSRARVRER
jgi:hypothetical protein